MKLGFNITNFIVEYIKDISPINKALRILLHAHLNKTQTSSHDDRSSNDGIDRLEEWSDEIKESNVIPYLSETLDQLHGR
jgi:hypothetical protein